MGVILQSIEEICSPHRLGRQGTDPSAKSPLGLERDVVGHEWAEGRSVQNTASLDTPGEEAMRNLGKLLSEIQGM